MSGFEYLELITDFYSGKIVGFDIRDTLKLAGWIRARKDEFYLDQTFFDLKHTQKATKNTTKLFNNVILHVSLNLKTPEKMYKRIA